MHVAVTTVADDGRAIENGRVYCPLTPRGSGWPVLPHPDVSTGGGGGSTSATLMSTEESDVGGK